jgi:hypothetical protein
VSWRERLGLFTQVVAEESVVPGEDLVDENVAIAVETARAGGDPDAQGEGRRLGAQVDN